MVDGVTRDIQKIAENILVRKRTIKQPWVSEDTLKLCDQRRDKKAKRFDGEKQAREYRDVNRMVRRELCKAK